MMNDIETAAQAAAFGRLLSGNPDRTHVFEEVQKVLLRSEKPSVFFETLRKTDQLEMWFPELSALIGVEQSAVHHKEGDVWTHTMMVLDQAAAYRDKVEDPTVFMLSALTHDFGKRVCTERINGELHSYRHEILGVPIAETFVGRLTDDAEIIRRVADLTKLHMRPNMLAQEHASVKASNRMFDQTRDPRGLLYLALADGLGKIPSLDMGFRYDYLTERLKIYEETMSRPHVTEEDLTAAGIVPDSRFPEYLAYAHKLRLSGVEKEIALKQTLSFIRLGR